MEVRAITKYVGISPQKTRWVIDQVRGMQAENRFGSAALHAAIGSRPGGQDHRFCLG